MTSFCEQKAAKKLFYSGPWAVAVPTPQAQSHKSFLVLFFKKEPLSQTLTLK
jgi:hypothetical protein